MPRDPVAELEREHRVIAVVVSAMGQLADALEAGRAVPERVLRDVVGFIRNYADHCHHGKEEDHLFRVLGERGVPLQGCPIGALLHEHVQGRTLVAALEEAAAALEAGHDGAAAQAVEALRGLAALYPNHIWKEDYLLFTMAGKVLGPADREALAQAFEAVDAAIGAEAYAGWEQLAERLAAEAATL